MKIKPLLEKIEMIIPDEVREFLDIHGTALFTDEKTGDMYSITKGFNQ